MVVLDAVYAPPRQSVRCQMVSHNAESGVIPSTWSLYCSAYSQTSTLVCSALVGVPRVVLELVAYIHVSASPSTSLHQVCSSVLFIMAFCAELTPYKITAAILVSPGVLRLGPWARS